MFRCRIKSYRADSNPKLLRELLERERERERGEFNQRCNRYRTWEKYRATINPVQELSLFRTSARKIP